MALVGYMVGRLQGAVKGICAGYVQEGVFVL